MNCNNHNATAQRVYGGYLTGYREDLCRIAREVCHKSGLPWRDPRTGIIYPPPNKRKKTKKKGKK